MRKLSRVLASSLCLLVTSSACSGQPVGAPSQPTEGDTAIEPTKTGGTVPNGFRLIEGGPLSNLPTYAGALAPRGRAQLAVTAEGETWISLSVLGLSPSTDYPLHLHQSPCEAGAGGHYQIDPSRPEVGESNEVWPQFKTDARGVGYVDFAASYAVGDGAASLVVHDPNSGGAKMACADLVKLDNILKQGDFALLPTSDAKDSLIRGLASLNRSPSTTDVKLYLYSLDPTTEYSGRVHTSRCTQDSGGQPYKVDPTLPDARADNELSVLVRVDSNGDASGFLTNTVHGARSDARSVVLNRTVGGSDFGVACADLALVHQDLYAGGESVLLPAGQQSLPGLKASTLMLRALTYVNPLTETGHYQPTELLSTLSGLVPFERYSVEVHDRPCNVNEGGDLYKVDRLVSGDVAENEISRLFVAGKTGRGSLSFAVPYLARADAQSVTIRNATDAARLACIDLEYKE